MPSSFCLDSPWATPYMIDYSLSLHSPYLILFAVAAYKKFPVSESKLVYCASYNIVLS